MKLKIKLGVLVMIIGVSGMIFGFAVETMSLFFKAIIFILSTAVIVLGAMIEMNIFEHWKNYPGEDFSSQNKLHEFPPDRN